jgi:hypothetical protein
MTTNRPTVGAVAEGVVDVVDETEQQARRRWRSSVDRENLVDNFW